MVSWMILQGCGGKTSSQPFAGGAAGAAGDSAGGTGGTNGVAGGAGQSEPSSLLGKAFDLTVPKSVSAGIADDHWCAGPCAPAAVLVTGVLGQQLQVVWGTLGHATEVTLSKAGGEWALQVPLQLGEELTWEYAMCADNTQLTSATFAFTGEGAGAALSIDGAFTSKYCSDDYTTGYVGQVTLTGAVDRRSPIAYGPSDGVSPMPPVSIALDKPLEPAATATARLATGEAVSLTPRLEAGYVVGFDSEQVFPLGARVTVDFTGDDYARVGSPSAVSWTTAEDFGLLTTDGFESGTTFGIRDATVVTQYGLPALSGQRMLHVAAGDAALLHLAALPGARTLELDAQAINECPWETTTGAVSVTVGRVGSSERAVQSVGLETSVETSVDGTAMWFGPVTHLSVPLPSGDGDVLVQFLGPYYYGAGCLRVGALVDDLSLQ